MLDYTIIGSILIDEMNFMKFYQYNFGDGLFHNQNVY